MADPGSWALAASMLGSGYMSKRSADKLAGAGGGLQETAEQKAAAQWLLDLLQRPDPTIPTAGVAGMAPAEVAGQAELMKYMEAPIGTGYQTGLTELEKTVGGEAYDPYTSPYWAALRESSIADEEAAVGGLRRGSQLGGMFYSEPSTRTEAELRSKYGTGRASVLGSLFETERGRQLSAVPQLMQYSQQSPELYKAQMGMMYGSLPREIEQSKLGAEYQQQYAQTMFPWEQQANIASILKGNPYTPASQYPTQSPFAAGMGGMTDAASLLAAMKQLGMFSSGAKTTGWEDYNPPPPLGYEPY